MVTLTQKELKKLKKEIIENGTVETGYDTKIWDKIKSYTIVQATMEQGLNPQRFYNEEDYYNEVLRIIVEASDFQTFKHDLAPCFTNYQNLVQEKKLSELFIKVA